MQTLIINDITRGSKDWPSKTIYCKTCKHEIKFMYSMPRMCSKCLTDLDVDEATFTNIYIRFLFHTKTLPVQYSVYGEVW